ncbi:MAG: hypothetical protein P4L57_08980 [Rhizomicrobium sp.]|nr:hypothetical protein [Rhizomicrobium sp.]
MRKLALILLCLLSGCVSAGTKVDHSIVETFQRGKTTYQEVVSQLGQPNGNYVGADGSRTTVYVYTHSQARAQSFIPIVGAFVAKADANSETYTFVFDQNGVLKTIGQGNSQATAGLGN